MPSTRAPMAPRNSHSSATCGSQAAWRISVMPFACAAASSAVSVPVTDASSRYIDAPCRPSGASRRWPGGSSTMRAAHRDERVQMRRDRASRREVAAGRRELRAARRGRAARRAAAPTRAAGRPASDRARTTRMSRHVTRSVDVPSPSTSAPSDRSRSIMTATSRMRGTLRSSHVSVVSRHAASSGSAAFLLPLDGDACPTAVGRPRMTRCQP